MPTFCRLTRCALLLLLCGATTAPVARSDVATLFAQLADVDPAVRDAAHDELMGLSADALPDLLAAVRAASPLHPAQAAVLPEIVRQVFLAGDDYPTQARVEGPRYIMGQEWPFGYSETRMGVPVVQRWIGFPARRYLHDGDLILGLFNDVSPAPDHPVENPTHDPEELIAAMHKCTTLPRVTMSVLRDGQVIQVKAIMAVEPEQTVDREAAKVAAFLNDRQRRADDYWARTFGPLVVEPAPESLDGTDR